MNNSLRNDLLRLLDEGQIGCLTVLARGGPLSVYVMVGEVVAAISADDDVQLLRRSVVNGLIERSQAGALMRDKGDLPLFEHMYGLLDEQIVTDMLFDRFKENLSTWLSAQGELEFEAMAALFPSVDHPGLMNLHTAHDSRALLGEIEVMLSRSSELSSDAGFGLELRAGSVGADHPDAIALVELVGSGKSVAQLVRSSPFEELRTLDRLATMLEAGELDMVDSSQLITVIDEEDPEFQGAAEEFHAVPKEATDDGPSKPTQRDLLGEEEIPDQELDLFADQDKFRGGDGGGNFSKSRTELTAEKVDLSATLPPPPVAAPKPRASGVSVKFSGPMLSVEDARRKAAVLNEVLGTYSASFDEANGRGSGPSQVQLLLDGSPSEFSVLFHKIEAAANGTVSPEGILSNLRRRPTGEHRRLLNRALADLIERAMNSAAEGLDEDSFDRVLEKCAGFQQRLGI